MDSSNQTNPRFALPPVHLPEDILQLIIQHLSIRNLKECCLSSKILRHYSRPLIFASVLLEDIYDVEELASVRDIGETRRNVSDFRELLDGSLDIGPLVRSLTVLYTSHPDPSNHTFNVSGWAQNFQSVITEVPNLVAFTFGRLGIRTVHLNWEKDVPASVGCTIQSVLTLPTLKKFIFHDSFNFGTTKDLLDLFHLDGHCSVDTFEVTAQVFDDSKGTPLSVSPYQAKIARLGLSYVNFSTQKSLIPALLSPASPFNVRNLACVSFSDITEDDSPWISNLLNDQETSCRLQCLEMLDLYDVPGKDWSFFKSLQRFTNIHTIATSFDESTDERDECETTITLWIEVLPDSVLSQIEKFILIWVPLTPFGKNSPRYTRVAFDRMFTNGTMPKLKSVIIQVQQTVSFFDEFPTTINTEELNGNWYEIAVDLLPKACNNGIVSVDTSLVD
ncbi:hypothetical protein DL96DRAFT_1551567 [Flagelloscypha sp. PMI_526]|nr:hypothetical protein DL96DRAFT_1551567 [Flagelloscypha sp. PMI_526]